MSGGEDLPRVCGVEKSSPAIPSKRARESDGSDTSPPQISSKKKQMLSREEEDRLCSRLSRDLTASLSQSLSNMLSEKLRNVAKKEDINHLSNVISEMKESEKEVRLDVEALKLENINIKRHLDVLERRSRQDKLVVRGFVDAKGDVRRLKADLDELLSGILGGDPPLIKQAYQGRAGTGILTFVQLCDESVIPNILQNAKKKNTAVTISRDMALEARTRCNRMLRLRYEIRKLAPNAVMKIAYDQLIVKDKKFEWVGDKLVSGGRDGVEVVKQLIGVDVSAILEAIVSYRSAQPRTD
ncbi:hypothetical protein GE061_014357 [Apolygus lucorum]|uniref:Uncharacterized protein n=1 Tax=Apolygus lucorum TaxID=248454 RepID=A0A6A4K943_APOLU|nr:hypothetical protein GE061_014357 [Apolygus lucorum]